MNPLPPRVPGQILLGNTLAFGSDRQKLLRKAYETYGPIFNIKLGPQQVAVLIGPEYQQFFFTETDKKLSIDKPYTNLKAALGDVAFLASPQVYYEQRPILHSPFGREKMLKYYSVMQSVIQKWLDKLGDSGEMDIVTEMNQLVQEVAGNALMGGDFQQRVGREFWDQYNVIGRSLDMVTPPNLPLPKNLRRERAKKRMQQILQPIIEERRASSVEQDDFLQSFLSTPSKSGAQATDEEIFALLRALMFASHETTAGQAAWTIIEILRHPAYEGLARQDIDRFFPAGSLIGGTTLRNMQHILWAVQEIERLHPSADILMRIAEEDIELCGYRIPKGWGLMVAPCVAHRIPELFKNPDEFDPLRFGPGREEDRQHRFALIGFGGGVHKCAGINFANNEMMSIAALLFQQFDLQLRTPNPGIRYGMGAVRPEPTIIHYKRKTPAGSSRN